MWNACTRLWDDGPVRDHFGKKWLLSAAVSDADLFTKPMVALVMKVERAGHDGFITVLPIKEPHMDISWLRSVKLSPLSSFLPD
jgi:hypothetical protein